jgi:hypothetical protein
MVYTLGGGGLVGGGRHLHVAPPHAFVLFLTPSLPPTPPIDYSTLTQTKGGTNLDLHWGSDSQKSKLKVPSSPWRVVVISQGPSPDEEGWGPKNYFYLQVKCFHLLTSNEWQRIIMYLGLMLVCHFFADYLFIYLLRSLEIFYFSCVNSTNLSKFFLC